jgi:low affinity Fe/Cu permease
MRIAAKEKKGPFRVLAEATADVVGSSTAFIVVIVITLAWAVSGFFFQFSDTWQLIINTFTNIATLMIVVLIQATQNRDARAIHLKLDELIRAMKHARASMIDVEDLSDEDLERLQEQFERLKRHADREPAA